MPRGIGGSGSIPATSAAARGTSQIHRLCIRMRRYKTRLCPPSPFNLNTCGFGEALQGGANILCAILHQAIDKIAGLGRVE